MGADVQHSGDAMNPTPEQIAAARMVSVAAKALEMAADQAAKLGLDVEISHTTTGGGFHSVGISAHEQVAKYPIAHVITVECYIPSIRVKP